VQDREIIRVSLFPEICIRYDTDREEKYKQQISDELWRLEKWWEKISIEKKYKYRRNTIGYIVTVPHVDRVEEYKTHWKKIHKMEISKYRTYHQGNREKK
jgi:hypothetical protein